MKSSLVYRPSKARSTRSILTREQIKDLGKLLGARSLRESMVQFMDPANMYLLSKPKLLMVHKYIHGNGLTDIKPPSSRIRIREHARLLVDILYPGHPTWRARENAFRQERENRAPHNRPDLAYDKLPTDDQFERQDEIYRIDLNGSDTHFAVPAEAFQKMDKNTSRDIRLHLYLWLSPRVAIVPECQELCINAQKTWTTKDKENATNGKRYIDITTKADWRALTKEKDTITFDIQWSEKPTLRHISICTVWAKTPAEMVSYLYIQTAMSCIAKAMDTSDHVEDTQQKAIQLLNSCPPTKRHSIAESEALFTACFQTFQTTTAARHSEAPDDEELVLGDQSISLLDPVLLKRITHPARGVHCSHAACFDAEIFMTYPMTKPYWTCPHCFSSIKGLQDMYMDYRTKQALTAYPDAERLILRDGILYPDAPLATGSEAFQFVKEEPKDVIDLDASNLDNKQYQ